MKFIDLTGQKFNRLTILEYKGASKWLCKCDCGKEIIVASNNLKNGHTKSCGCLKIEKSIKHGYSKTRLYTAYINMKRRCMKTCKTHGGRGITICEEWINKENGFNNFVEWSLKNGFDKNKTGLECSLDRINNNGNYKPSNCRWTDIKTQSRNTRQNHNITYNGETHCISEWAEILNINSSTLRNRMTRHSFFESIII